jgi:hypothetical protein
VNTREKISRELVVAGGDGAKVLEFIEEALDENALAVEGKVTGWRRLALALGGITGVISRLASVSRSGSAS